MQTSIFDDGLVKPDGWKYFNLSFSEGVGKSPWDQVTELIDKKYLGTVWRIESRTFACCGTSAFESLDGVYDCVEMAQEFLAIILQYYPYYGKESWKWDFKNHNDVWMVDTGYNISHQPENSFFNLLVKLGAKEVYRFPNRCHGPEDLHLYTWNPQDCVNGLKEYLHIHTITRKYGAYWPRFIPLYLKEQFEHEQRQQLEDQASARPAAPAAPRVAVPTEAPQARERGLDGAAGVGDV